ncbi:MAG: EAL domain-containing protein [Mastigocoleus sp.]
MLEKSEKFDEYRGVILVVDDTPCNLNVLFSHLREAGFKVLVAQTGENALKSAEYIKPNLILLDILMSGVDGFEVCSRLKQNQTTKDIPIIFMTALSDSTNKVQGFELGAVDYITKPIQKEELLARIHTHISIEKMRQNLVEQNLQLQRQAREEKFLSELCERIRYSLNVNSIMQTAAYEILEFLKCDRVLISSLSGYRNYIEEQALKSGIIEIPRDNFSQKFLINKTEELIRYTQGKFQEIKDIETADISDSYRSFLKEFDVKATFNIPILFKNAISDHQSGVGSVLWGFLTVHQCQTSRKWFSEEIGFVQRVVNQLAIAIQQARLYKSLNTANQELKQLALCDSLTKVFNRRYFDKQLFQEWNRLRRIPSPLSLIMCDVDCFKAYNDSYGHQAGDECLRTVADAISSIVKRPADCIARYGGEEFVIILPYTPPQGALKVAEAISKKIKQLNIPHTSSSVSSSVTVSMGVASCIPTQEDNPILLVEAADQALYLAKGQGRDRIQIYQHDLSREKSRKNYQLLWAKKLRQALERNHFCLYTQPIIPLKKGNDKIHHEVLLRLLDEDNQIVSPETFLDIANLYSMMPRIDTWVVDHLFRYLADAEFKSWGDICFAINISGASLNDNQFLNFLCQQFQRYNLPPDMFCFEITETVAITNLSQTSAFINSLKSIGCSFALDDFGKGMSSLTYLKNLPVDYLKIDGSFIKEINSETVTKAMVQAINYLAKAIGVKTVAEFAVNKDIVDILKDLEVDYAQGYYFGEPSLINDSSFAILETVA